MCLKESFWGFFRELVNFNVHERRIGYQEIQNVQKGIKINSMILELKHGEKEEFIVNNRKEWIQMIETQIRK